MHDRHPEVLLRKFAGEDLVDCSIHIVKGEKAILRLQPLLIAYCERCCGRSGTLLDLGYFLQKPGLLKRVPYLYLVSKRPGVPVHELQPDDLAGTLLLLEYRVLKLGTRAYATNDRSGRGTLLAMPADRVRVASLICEVLLDRGANVAMLSFADGDGGGGGADGPVFRRSSRSTGRMSWAMRRRLAPAYLQLQPTLDATMAILGLETRRNMRRYRRRAENELGCVAEPAADASPADLVRFNLECMYPVSKETVLWRLNVLKALHDPFLMVLKDRDGRWLSVLGGRRFNDTSEILWQMNRAGYPSHSLGTVMRSYCMEFEIARGAKRLEVEGGTFHTMHHSFVQEEIVDLVVVRSRSRRILRELVNRFIPADNSLADMLKDKDLSWHPGRAESSWLPASPTYTENH